MTKKLLFIILACLIPSMLLAQKKELDEARTNIKKGTNLEKTEATMRKLLKDSVNVQNEKIWLTLFDVVKKQYEQLNEKLYLKQQSDTSKLFTHTKHMFDVLESLDSIDVVNTNNQPAYRKKHAAYLDSYRKNLFNGGAYYIKKGNYKEAVAYFDCYVNTAIQPLFGAYDYDNKDEEGITNASYWLTYCGYKLHDVQLIERYSDVALRDKSREVYTLQYMAEAAMLKKDNAGYRSILERGFEQYPDHAYFFPHLANFYVEFKMYREILGICDKALSIDENNVDALAAYSTALYDTGRYASCIEVTDRLLQLSQDIPRAYLNAGLSYYHQADDLFKLTVPTKTQRQQMTDICTKALPYMERYREMQPDDIDSYALPLYNIYLTLNIGDGFEEMDRLLYGE